MKAFQHFDPRTIAKLIVSGSVGLVIGNAIKATTPSGLSLPVKAALGLGSLILSGMVGDFAAAHVDKEIDDLIVQVKETAEAPEEETTNDN